MVYPHLGVYWDQKYLCIRKRDYPLSYGVPVRERYGSTLLPATESSTTKTVHRVINKRLKTYV